MSSSSLDPYACLLYTSDYQVIGVHDTFNKIILPQIGLNIKVIQQLLTASSRYKLIKLADKQQFCLTHMFIDVENLPFCGL